MDEHDAFETVVAAKNISERASAAWIYCLRRRFTKRMSTTGFFSLIEEDIFLFTVHAGQYNTQSIRKAIHYGAQRISQSVRILDDKELMEDIIRRKVVVEICPASNIKLGGGQLQQASDP